jgi:hypothetical protein
VVVVSGQTQRFNRIEARAFVLLDEQGHEIAGMVQESSGLPAVFVGQRGGNAGWTTLYPTGARENPALTAESVAKIEALPSNARAKAGDTKPSAAREARDEAERIIRNGAKTEKAAKIAAQLYISSLEHTLNRAIELGAKENCPQLLRETQDVFEIIIQNFFKNDFQRSIALCQELYPKADQVLFCAARASLPKDLNSIRQRNRELQNKFTREERVEATQHIWKLDALAKSFNLGDDAYEALSEDERDDLEKKIGEFLTRRDEANALLDSVEAR